MDYKINTLFGETISFTVKNNICSIGYNEQKIISDILFLHTKQRRIDVDPTYSIGNFYKGIIEKPRYKFDKYPQLPEVKEASSDNLPLDNESVEVIMFDPPFVMGGQNYKENKIGSSIIAKRFTNFKNFDDLSDMYYKSMIEFFRILKIGGILIFKCQDCIVSSKQYFTHCEVFNWAKEIGFYPRDLFILLARGRIIGKVFTQRHCRKFHSYFWVFEKEKEKKECT
jgi:hypothetical protein